MSSSSNLEELMRLTRVKNRIDNIWDKYSIFLDDLVKLSVNENECEVSLIELLQFSNRIKSTAFAPQYWREVLLVRAIPQPPQSRKCGAAG